MKPRGAIRADRADALQLLFLIAPAFVYLVVFQYVPMWGAQIAFKDYSAGLGTWQSPWAGFKHFRQYFASYYSAIALNYVGRSGTRRTLQTVFYAPNFISVTVVASMIFIMLSPSSGLVNYLIRMAAGEPGWFYHVFTLSTAWQFTGLNAITYLGVLTSIDPGLHESAMIDGAGKLLWIVSIDIPVMVPTMTVLLILNSAGSCSSASTEPSCSRRR